MLGLQEKIPAEGQHTDVSDDAAFHTLEVMISSLSHQQHHFRLPYIWKHSDTLEEILVIANKSSLLLKSQKVPCKTVSLL